MEVRRGTFDVMVDGKHVASIEMNDTIEMHVGDLGEVGGRGRSRPAESKRSSGY